MKRDSTAIELSADYLSITQLKFTFTVLSGGKVNEFLGSSIRGALGRALKESVCNADKETKCIDCFYKSRCAYTQLFEPLRCNFKISSSKLSSQNQIPAPLVVRVDSHQTLSKGELFSFNLTIMRQLLPEEKQLLLSCFTAFTLFSKTPIKLRLSNIEQIMPFSWIDTQLPLTIKFKSPLQIKLKGKTLKSSTFELTAFLLTLIRRVVTLSLFYGESIPEQQEALWRGAIKNVALTNKALTDITWNRYSFKQQRSVPMQGVFGNVELTGKGVEVLLPLLQLGEQIHVGKGSFMGLGSYLLSN